MSLLTATNSMFISVPVTQFLGCWCHVRGDSLDNREVFVGEQPSLFSRASVGFRFWCAPFLSLFPFLFPFIFVLISCA